jgi:F-type H+-transporting ATPase subunit delta
MAYDAVAARYAESLFAAAKPKRALDGTLEQLELLGRLLTEQPELREFLYNPDVEPGDKVGVLERALAGGWSELVQAFLRMVLSMGRAETLPGIVEAFREAVDRDQGRIRVMVRSAHPLPEDALKRLRHGLERREGKVVALDATVDPTLIGGVQILLDHRLIDGSVRRQLDELREQLTSVRVS